MYHRRAGEKFREASFEQCPIGPLCVVEIYVFPKDFPEMNLSTSVFMLGTVIHCLSGWAGCVKLKARLRSATLVEAMTKIQKKIFADMSPTRKLRAVLRLRNSAMTLKAAWLRQKHPDWSDERVALEVRKIFTHAGS